MRLFNARPVIIGRGMNNEAEFPDAVSLVAHLDYLEVERSLVCHREAVDVHPTYGNRKLLEEIKDFPHRLVPALVISPHLVFESEGMDHLKATLDQGRRALCAFPAAGRYQALTLERLLDSIRDYRPILFMDMNEAKTEAFVLLAETFPELTFVGSGIGRSNIPDVLDMLWRHPNILVEHSLNYFNNGIETIADKFGPDRGLFGFKFKSHYGAPVAALGHAQLASEIKRRIAGGTLQDLLGIGPFGGEINSSETLERKPLWRSYRQGAPVSGVEIIDAHAHSGPMAFGVGFLGASVEPDNYIRNYLAILDRNGVDQALVSHMPALFGDALAGNRELEAVCAKHGDNRFWGYLSFNPHYHDELTPEVDAFFAGDFFKGFKVLPDYWSVPITDPRYKPVWDYANRHRLPILAHTWEGGRDNPALLKDIVPKHPDAIFLLGHSGGQAVGRAEAVALAKDNPNVFLEFCGSFTTPEDYVDVIKELGIERIVFGSDMYGHNLAWELGRFLSLPFPDDELLPALADNAKRILARRRKPFTTRR